ncbi:MAG: Bug family tripartite tricarboxylate transporter substrate binding protein [Rhodospirillales bacterium]
MTGHSRRVHRALAVVAALAAFACPASGAWAEEWPSKPVKIVIPFPPGGATDVLGRVVADKLGPLLGQPAVIENKPGAGGNLAAALVAKAPADGYTVMVASNPGFTTGPALTKEPGYDAVKDFDAITMLATQSMLLALHPSLAPDTLKDFVAYVKANPGKLNYATPGIGTPHHLAMEMFKLAAGLDIVHVPYRGGGPATQAVVAGQVTVMFGSNVIVGPHRKTGALKAIAASGAQRVTQAPDVPTIAELGYPGFDVTSWFGLIGPAGMPPAAVARLAKDTKAVLAMPEVKEKLLGTGFDLAPEMTTAAFGTQMKKDVAEWAKAIKDAKIEPQ